uniref:Uncharacterized protein n=1 Tax=Cajanus cajan TaxID=3821 RepID=A0A151RFR9_CAJCA|nr:hypothetical protein KK1_037230 [Cajanus cajan]
MIRNVGVDSIKCAHVYNSLYNDVEKPLYLDFANFTRLSTMLRFDMLLEGNTLPTHNSYVRKILCPMGMKYKTICACLNDSKLVCTPLTASICLSELNAT